MDFHRLSRRELQSLCKLNKIPANITNVAMADALQSLEIVNGIEEFMNVSNAETADLVDSMEKVEVFSPKAPTTRCRTSTQPKVKIIEPENLPPKTAARSTRRGKQLAGEVEESKNEIPKTPAISTTRRKAPATLSCRNVNRQLNECEKEAKEEAKLQKPYSTRRSSRLTEKKSTEPRVKKESAKALKMGSFVDEVNVTPECTVTSGDPAAEVEEICNAFEKLDVVIVDEEDNHKSGEEKQVFEDEMVVEDGDVNAVLEEVIDEAKEDSGEIDILKKESTNDTSNPCEDEVVVNEAKEDCGEINILKKESTNETSNTCEEKLEMGEEEEEEEEEDDEDDAKPESDGISSPFEFQNVEEKLNIQEAVSGNISIAVNDHNLVQEENSDLNDISSPFQEENLEQKIDLEDKTINASEAENLSEVLNQEKHSDFLLDNNASLESGAEDSTGSPELSHKDEDFERNFDFEDEIFDASEGNIFSAIKENNQVLGSNGPSIDLVIDNAEIPSVMEEVPENTVDVISTIDLKSDELLTENIVNEKTDEITNADEKDQFRAFFAPCFFNNGTPFKSMNIISDGKENVDSGRKLQIGFVDEGKKRKKEEKTEIEKLTNYNEISMRQLKKQLKLLTLKSVDAKKEGAATTRPALQTLCENQLVGGESKN